MTIKAKYEDQDNIYEIPVEKILKFLKLSKNDFESACKQAIKEM